jgi:hypothetical protein
MNIKGIIIFSVLISLQTIIPAQEYINALEINAQVKLSSEFNSEKQSKVLKKEIIELPFWDDFSDSFIFPKNTLWADSFAYINSSLAPNPISIGVATLDALNEKGVVYEHADYLTPFTADFLTSQPINLNYPTNNSIYFSFYYRPSVFEDYNIDGAEPEPGDSLILEFYAPQEDVWYKMWAMNGNNDTEFKYVILPINEEHFLKSGFKFRFKNIASFGSATYPSLAGNCDFWHIDYVYLNKNRTVNDNIFHDIAYTKPLHSLITNYESIPWSHYKTIGSQTVRDKINISYKNNDNVMRIIERMDFTLTDLSGTATVQDFFGGTFSLTPFSEQSIELAGHNFIFPYNDDEFCDFELKADFITSTFDSSQNNSLRYTQKFRDYYAYDDGSAEAGYGIYGNGTKFSSVAYKFSPVKADKLNGAYIYFTRSFKDASQKYFWLNVWSIGSDGKPDVLINSLEGQLPEYADELNQFIWYGFEQPIDISTGFFIGWTQTTEDKLNVGFDVNSINNEHLFYNISGDWVQSEIAGSVMIRPAFGNTYVGKDDEFYDKTIKIYPNPVYDFLNIEFNFNVNEIKELKIFDIHGRTIYSENNYNQSPIQISQLTNGIYLINLTDINGNTYSSRFIKK